MDDIWCVCQARCGIIERFATYSEAEKGLDHYKSEYPAEANEFFICTGHSAYEIFNLWGL